MGGLRTEYLIGGVIVLAVVIFGLIQSGNPKVSGPQLSCADPFAGQQVRFSTGFWTKTDFCQHSVPYGEFRSGGPPPDGIPPIDNPQFESIDTASRWLQEQSPVISVEVNGDARAYPLAVMIWHEIANDTVGDVPVAITFCPLCNSSIVYNREVDGEVLRFGVSGNLRNSDLVMWDNLTQSWWQQFTGEAIVGVHTGKMLEIIPSQVVNFGAFAEEYPDGTVLSRETGFNRNYGSNSYAGYDSSERPFLFEGSIDRRLRATERVLAGLVDGQPIAYPFPVLQNERVINDHIGDTDVVAFWQPGKSSALDGRSIDNSRDVGTAALYRREVDDGGVRRVLTFTFNDGAIIDNETGSTWNIFGRAIDGELEGTQLQQHIAAPHFWFAWAAFQPDTAIYGA
ncbi:MAG: DUF3179 domain-containing protein [Chloroflexi bacterium]|nr:MAG: DUF3179 domain-containing protein [Chloroflexota bacterium]